MKDVVMDDAVLIRQTALAEAVRLANSHGLSPDEIVKAAEKFETFLLGQAPRLKEVA